MDDLISRQAAIDAIYHHLPSVSRTRARTMLHEVPSAQPENQVHLCDSCRHVYPECPSEKDDVIFGNGKGNDNICACNKYEPSAQPEIIRCKDCIYYDPPHVENNGVRYEYDEMPADAFDALGTGLVNAEYGINIGGRCCVDYYCKHYSDDKRVFVREDNYCGRAERKTECCPVCGRTLGVSQFVKTQTGFRVGDPYCKRCGQAIDWKEGE